MQNRTIDSWMNSDTIDSKTLERTGSLQASLPQGSLPLEQGLYRLENFEEAKALN